ncbi:MAG: flavin reductase family protein [Cohaesibacteraceae bacterium]|nr:flavin reductase family protein [Cohaesibacteraceae bacterium]MBL4875005.1 flavin reductase family protein [Cohaesibacteraceae bacterium]
MDSRLYRKALSQFATGVTVVTSAMDNGAPVGMTVNSFNSVSLDPMLVLWSCQNSSPNLPVILERKAYIVHVLADEQQNLCDLFSQPADDKFSNLAFQMTASGLPKISGALAWFECELIDNHPGGDHRILVGRVLNFDVSAGNPLVYAQGELGSFSKLEK